MTKVKLLADKVYHIYHNNECIHSNLDELAFNRLWEYYHEEEVSVNYEYEVCDLDKEMISKSSY